MKKSNWFDTIFLPSLFEYAGPGVSKRITEKQAVCFCKQKGIKERQHANLSYYGVSYVVCTEYTYKWNGRNVSVTFYRNGPMVHFGETKEESEIRAKKQEIDRYKKECKDVKKMKVNRPEKFFEKLEKASENLYICIKCFDASAASEDDEELDDSIFDLEEAEKRYYKYYFA